MRACQMEAESDKKKSSLEVVLEGLEVDVLQVARQ